MNIESAQKYVISVLLIAVYSVTYTQRF